MFNTQVSVCTHVVLRKLRVGYPCIWQALATLSLSSGKTLNLRAKKYWDKNIFALDWVTNSDASHTLASNVKEYEGPQINVYSYFSWNLESINLFLSFLLDKDMGTDHISIV